MQSLEKGLSQVGLAAAFSPR